MGYEPTMRESPSRPGYRWLPALLVALPVGWVVAARGAAFGRFTVDLAGHLWSGWAVGRDGILHTRTIGWPEGVDLLPALGGWLDLILVGLLRQVLPLELAYNGVVGLYLVIAGLGGWLLARTLGASRPAALVAGVLLQLDGFVLLHLTGGRVEQVGLGLVACLVALVLRTWTGHGRHAPVLAAGVAALLAFASWELTLLAGLVVVFTLPFLVRLERAPGLLRRLGVLAATTLVLAGPWVGLFVARTAGVRAFDEAAFSLVLSGKASVGLLGWFLPGTARPCWLALLALLALPWTARRGHRLLWLGWGVGLALCLLLALGPAPGLLAPGDPTHGAWGPFAWFHGLPVLGWFHWPDRLLATWSLAAVVAVALAVDALGRRWRWAAVVVAALVVADAWVEARQAGRLPTGHYRVPEHSGAEQLALLPQAGAVLDLPPRPQPVQHLQYQLLQIRHGRPLRFHHHLQHLRGESGANSLAGDPVLAWFEGLMHGQQEARDPFSTRELEGLRTAGFAFVTLHRQGWPEHRWQRARALLLESLGEPVIQQGSAWICWRLPGMDEGE